MFLDRSFKMGSFSIESDAVNVGRIQPLSTKKGI
jgi:hypothetical protein